VLRGTSRFDNAFELIDASFFGEINLSGKARNYLYKCRSILQSYRILKWHPEIRVSREGGKQDD